MVYFHKVGRCRLPPETLLSNDPPRSYGTFLTTSDSTVSRRLPNRKLLAGCIGPVNRTDFSMRSGQGCETALESTVGIIVATVHLGDYRSVAHKLSAEIWQFQGGEQRKTL